jgi:hypothetical protein
MKFHHYVIDSFAVSNVECAHKWEVVTKVSTEKLVLRLNKFFVKGKRPAFRLTAFPLVRVPVDLGSQCCEH